MRKLDKDKRPKFLIFGRGQIGTMYYHYFLKKGYPAYLSGADITKYLEIEKEVKKHSPTIIVNCAAKTELEWVEKNKLEAFKVNTLGADNLAVICEKNGIYFLHLSSGCIFQSLDPKDTKDEASKPNPASFYSWTKVWSEDLITARKELKYLIIRLRQPVSAEVSEKNMLVKMLTFSKFVGQDGGWNSGTVLEDLMWITEKLIKKNVTGVIHVANSSWTTPYQIGLLLKKYINPEMQFEEISHQDLDKLTPVKRVAVVLDISKLESLGIRPKNYEERLAEIIKQLKKNLRQKGALDILQKTEKTSQQRTIVSKDWKKLF